MTIENDVSRLFLSDLKKFNLTNFRTLENADLSEPNPIIHKAFSAVITRYFLFCEKHPELSDTEKRIVYFDTKVDMISKYFSDYPESNIEDLYGFQQCVRDYSMYLKKGV